MADKTKTSAENQQPISTAGFKSAAHLVGFADGSAGVPGVLRSASPGIRSRGVDVSKWQGVIDWEKVKKSGVQFAILRAKVGLTTDPQFERNYRGAKAAGLPVGAYLYSYAKTEAAAKAEAKSLIQTLKGKKLEFPVYFDIEDNVHTSLSKKQCTAITKAFCTAMESAGYWVGVYSYDAFFANKLEEEVQTRYAVWVANVSGKPKKAKAYQMHQYSWKGRVDGIAGSVDMDETTVWYPDKVKKAGKNGY